MFIRPFNADDAHTFYRWYHDERMAHYFRGFIQGASLAQCAKAPELMRAYIHVGFNDDGLPVGAVTLADSDPIIRIYRLGLLVDPAHQNSGYARDLLAYGIKWSFETMCAHRIFVEILEEDTRVIRGAERAGLIHEGVSRQSCFLQGKFHNEVIFSLLSHEYQEKASCFKVQ